MSRGGVQPGKSSIRSTENPLAGGEGKERRLARQKGGQGVQKTKKLTETLASRKMDGPKKGLGVYGTGGKHLGRVLP